VTLDVPLTPRHFYRLRDVGGICEYHKTPALLRSACNRPEDKHLERRTGLCILYKKKASIVAGQKKLLPRSVLHLVLFHAVFLTHLDRHYIDLVLVGVDVCADGNLMPFMTFQCVRVADSPIKVAASANRKNKFQNLRIRCGPKKAFPVGPIPGQ
jgi:hypothetical protein